MQGACLLSPPELDGAVPVTGVKPVHGEAQSTVPTTTSSDPAFIPDEELRESPWAQLCSPQIHVEVLTPCPSPPPQNVIIFGDMIFTYLYLN